MNLASVATAARPVAAPVIAMTASAAGMTETQLAAKHFTPESRKLLPDALLNARVGRSTLAGSLNDQIRFRVERDGKVADWKIVPDSPNAAAIVQSKAGPTLLRQLETSMRSTGKLEAVSNLKGFILAEDTESVTAGYVLSMLSDRTDVDGKKLARLGELGRTSVAGRVMRKLGGDLAEGVARAGAWNAEGWITFMPDTSRAMLINAGAYDPHRSHEKRLLEAKKWTDYISGNGPHEVQHSVSDPSPTAYKGTAKWMEEGTAHVFSRTPTFKTRNAIAANQLPQVYAGHLAHGKPGDLGDDAVNDDGRAGTGT